MTSITPVRTLVPATPVTNVPTAAPAAPALPVAAPAAPAVGSAAGAQAKQGASAADGRPGRQGKVQFDAALKGALSKDPQSHVAVDKKSNTATLVSGDFTFDVNLLSPTPFFLHLLWLPWFCAVPVRAIAPVAPPVRGDNAGSTVISTRVAPACRKTLVSASWIMR